MQKHSHHYALHAPSCIDFIANGHDELFDLESPWRKYKKTTLDIAQLADENSVTVIHSTKNYVDYISAQLGDHDEESSKLRAIDLKFDPYSDNPHEDYEILKETVESLEILYLLNRELMRGISHLRSDKNYTSIS